MAKPINALMLLADEYAHEAARNNEYDNRTRMNEARIRLREALTDAIRGYDFSPLPK